MLNQEFSNLQILIVEDDELQQLTLNQQLKKSGITTLAASREQAFEAMKKNPSFDLVFLDLDLLDGDLQGLTLIEPALALGAYVVILSGREDDEHIIEAYEKGCHDYLTKPFNKKAIELVLKKYSSLKSKGSLRDFLARDYITRDQKLIQSLDIINEIVISEEPVMLTGPTGTGKSYLAKLIHGLLGKKDENFIELNCSEIPENLLESELFGYEKGAFSGAEGSKKGKLLLADGGTLFLDEVATMPESLQKKLLKAIEEKRFYPLGSEKPVQSNFRLISATCEDLKQLVKDGNFREDLFFRIDGFNINIPALKDRREDVDFLLKHFVRNAHRKIVFANSAKEVLRNYIWPGNVRELKKLVERLSLKSKGVIEDIDLPNHVLLNNHPCGESPVKTQKDQDTSSINGEAANEMALSESQLAFVEKNGLRAFLQQIENKMVKHFYVRNNEKVRQTLGQLKISNSSFYKILGRVKGEMV